MPHKHATVYENYIRSMLTEPSLNLGSGKFRIGDVNVDMDKNEKPDLLCNIEIFPYPFKNNSFGSIVLHHSLEHLKNPDLVIKECKRLLRPNGKIVIVVPSKKNENYRMRGHKVFFTKKTLRGLVVTNFKNVRCFGYRGDTRNISPLFGRVIGAFAPNQYICTGEMK